ncbi:hypothetical protein K9U40_02815 [Xanthobacter autotrophicus]|uniref:hypothetical protein n=1 Tax=Xanthobacter TaxID=279 RepID=UPI0024AC77C4|nr:hypothetical protein [Xanthobacter autotrophicus]MDI4663276.1 hypothetical protein [Xanthobacter autotrophicus]
MQDPAELEQERAFLEPDARTADGAPVKPAVKARQGLATGRVLTVLVVGLVLVVIAFAAGYIGAV